MRKGRASTTKSFHRIRASLRNAGRLVSIAICTAAVASACKPDGRVRGASSDTSLMQSQPSADLHNVRVLGGATIGKLVLRPVDTIALGHADSSPAEVRATRVINQREYVLDFAGHALRVFDRSGQVLYTVPIGGPAQAALATPIDLAVRHDTVFVLDLNKEEGISAYDYDGNWLSRIPLKSVGSSMMDIAVDDSTVLIAATLLDSDIRSGDASIVRVVNLDGHSAPVGCAPDSKYRESIVRNGLLQIFRAFGVSSYGGLVYCRQVSTPVVQIIGRDGRRVGVENIAPPHYLWPPEAPMTQNVMAVNRYRSKWMAHTHFYPRPSGFLSVYTTYDQQRGSDVYRLFSCDSARGPVGCDTVSIAGVPQDFIEPDTLAVLAALRDSDDVQRLVLYQLIQ